MGSIFQNLPKFEPNLAQIWENFGKIGWFCSKFGPIGIWMGHFFLKKKVFALVYFQIPWWHIPTKTKLEYPQAETLIWIWHDCLLRAVSSLTLDHIDSDQWDLRSVSCRSVLSTCVERPTVVNPNGEMKLCELCWLSHGTWRFTLIQNYLDLGFCVQSVKDMVCFTTDWVREVKIKQNI